MFKNANREKKPDFLKGLKKNKYCVNKCNYEQTNVAFLKGSREMMRALAFSQLFYPCCPAPLSDMADFPALISTV